MCPIEAGSGQGGGARGATKRGRNPNEGGFRPLEADNSYLLFFFQVASLGEELPETGLPIGEGGPSHEPGEPDPVILGHAVEYPDGCAVSEEDPLGVHGY